MQLPELLSYFIGNYQKEKLQKYTSSAFTKIITADIPKLLSSYLKTDTLTVNGSVGQGGWSEIPWVAIMDSRITKTTREGFYVVLLMDAHSRSLVLALQYGWTAFKEKYGTTEGRAILRGLTGQVRASLPRLPAAYKLKEPDLEGMKGALAKGYVWGTIVYKEFDTNEGFSESELLNSIDQMLDLYEELVLRHQNADGAINEANTLSTEKQIKEKSEEGKLDEVNALINAQAPEVKERLLKYAVRCKSFAEEVKRRANYICEICHRPPFKTKGGGLYAEADHIQPLNAQGVDHPLNMRCLCAQCHAVITYGADEEVSRLIGK